MRKATAPTTANVGYIDIAFQPVTGYELDAASIVDALPEFVLTGAVGSVQLSTTLAPLRLTSSDTFRYFLTGDFAAGPVSVAFQANSVQSVRTNAAGVTTAVGNLASAERFTYVIG